MRLLVLAGAQSPLVHTFARLLISDREQKDFAGEIADCFQFVRDGIRYVHDPVDTEMLHTADQILRVRAGDCDDKVVLLCALLASIGNPTRLHAVGFVPGQLSHVYCDVSCNGEWGAAGEWVALDATEPVEPGWQPRRVREHVLLENREC